MGLRVTRTTAHEDKGTHVRRGQTRSRGWRAGALAMIVAAFAAGVAPGAQAAPFAINDPAAGIDDPLAGMETLDRNCGDGQLDVNTASRTDLEHTLAISTPTTSRVLEARPFLRSVDLISVPGIGPEKLRLLERKACAEPVELPEPTPLACETGTDAVDLQSASVEEIVAKTGLEVDPVKRLVAARPLPQDLQDVRSPRVPGLAGPVAAGLVATGKVCVTPAPFTFAGRGWRWSSEAGGAVISAPADERYQLFVGPGVAAGPIGAWGTVRPLPEIDPGRPRADYHLYGPWEGTVGVRLPDARLAATDTPFVIHDGGNGTDTYTWGNAAALAGDSVTVAVDTLSEFESSSLACTYGFSATGALFDCGDSPADEPLEAIGVRQIYQTQSLIEPTFTTGPCDDSARVHSEGRLPNGLTCTNTAEGPPTVTWSLTNTTGAAKLAGLWEPTGAMYTITPLSQSGFSLGFESANLSAEKWFAEELASRHGLLLSDTTLKITKSAGSARSAFDVGGTGPAKASLVWTVANIVSVLNSTLDAFDVVASAERETVECLAEIALSASASALTACIEGAVGEGWSAQLEKEYDELDGRTTEAKRLKDRLRLVKAVVGRVAVVGNAVSSAIEQAATWSVSGETVRFWYDLPPLPPGPGGGSGGTNGAGAFDGTITNDTSSGGPVMIKLQSRPEQGWVVLGNYLAHEIADVPSYTCFAHRLALRDQLPAGKLFDYWTSESQDEIFCDSATTDQYFLSGNETNVILRQYASGGGPAPAWFVDGQSRLHPIPDGGTYICLAQRYYVLDARRDAEMAQYAGEETGSATCP